MALYFVSDRFCGLVNFALLETSAERNLEKLRRRTTVFTSTDIQLPTLNFVFFVTSLPWMHGLQTDCMI